MDDGTEVKLGFETVADPGFPEGVSTPQKVQNLLFDSFGDFAKMKEFGPKGGIVHL